MPNWPNGEGETARLIRARDWGTTPLGPADAWSDRLRLMVEQVVASPLVASLVCGPERILIYNDAAARFYGDHHPGALGRPLPESFPAGWATVAPFYERAFNGEVVQVAGQVLDIGDEGAARDVFDALLSPVREADGRVAYVHMTGAEVGDRARIEAALRESETRHRLLIESWAQAVWESDADGVVIADSPSWRLYTGQTLEEWLGYGWLDAIHPDDRAYAERQWRAAVAARTRVDAEFRLRAPDGGWRWTNVRAAPVLDAGGHIDKWAGLNIDIDARKRAEAALRKSEEKYRSLFGSMDEAYAVVQVLKDGAGRWVDFRFLDANRAFAEHTSMPYPVGKTATELLGSPNPRWTELYGQALDTGSPIRTEEAEPTLGRIFDLNIFTLDRAQNQVAVLFTDITARKRAEIVSRENEARQAFLLKLSDALRPIADPLEIQRVASRILGQHLGASRVFYVEVQRDGDTAAILGDYTDGVASRVGQYSLSAFSTYEVGEWRAGRTAKTSDVDTDPRYSDSERAAYASVSTRAGFGIPLIKEKRLVALLGVNQSSPRPWSGYDIDLAGDVAERTWAACERARAEAALRESEERLRQFGEASQDVLWIRDAETLQWTYLTPAFETIYGLKRQDAMTGDNYRNWQELIVPEDRARATAGVDRVRAGQPVTFEYRIRRASDGQVRWLRDTDFPMRDETGRVSRLGGIGQDVTGLKAVETALTRSEGRFRALVEGMSQLVWRAVDGGDWVWASPQWTAFTGQAEADSHRRGWLHPVHPDDRSAALVAWKRAGESGSFEAEFRIRNAVTGAYRWFQARAAPRRGSRGEVVEWFGTSTDVHQLKVLQESQAVMVAELQHRTRNLIAVVRGIAEDTMDETGPTEAFGAVFSDRLAALSRVQGLLSRAEVEPITMMAVVRLELDALGTGASDDRVVVAGSDVWLRNSTVQTLALALHELATNARKYGALSHDRGRLSVTWSERAEDGERRLVLDWVETGLEHAPGRTQPAPGDGGYGRELIEQALPHALGARTAYALTDTGLRCRIDLPSRPASMNGTTP